MTVAWAIIIVAILFLLDRHHLLKKTLIVGGVVVVLLAIVVAAVYGYQQLHKKWEAYQFAKHNECFNLATGKVHPVNEAGDACGILEQVHQRGTPLPPMLPTCQPDQPITFTPITPGSLPIPDGSVVGGEHPCVVRPTGQDHP